MTTKRTIVIRIDTYKLDGFNGTLSPGFYWKTEEHRIGMGWTQCSILCGPFDSVEEAEQDQKTSDYK